jgi:hypothetical protein
MTTTEFTSKLLPQPIARYVRIPGRAVNGVLDLLVTTFTLLFQVVMILAQTLQVGYNPLRDTISSMVWGRFGWLQTLNFYLIGFFMVLLIRRLKMYLPNNKAAQAGRAFLYVIAIGFIILGICPTQSPGSVKTIQAIIHGIAVYFITFSFPVSCFLLASSLRKGNGHKHLLLYTFVTGYIGLGLIAFGVYLNIIGAHWFGMLERLLLLSGFMWLEILYLVSDITVLKPQVSDIKST